MKGIALFLVGSIIFQHSFAVVAQDANGPIENIDETVVIEANVEAPVVQNLQNIDSEQQVTPTSGTVVLEKPSKKKSKKSETFEKSVFQTTSLELNTLDPVHYSYSPRQFIPNSTSLGSLELSSTPKWIKPDDMLRIEDAKIDPTSIQSFDAQAKGMTYCSWITRNNLERLTKLQDRDGVRGFDGKGILIGDAIDIIEQGLKTNIFKEVYLDDGSIEKYMSRVNRHTKATLFDIYIHHTKMENRFFAGHRVTGFLGTDDQWYILDPVMIHTQDPMRASEYFKKYGKPEQDRIYILRTGYAPAGYSVDPYPMMAVKYFAELKPLLDREDIILTKSGSNTMVAFNTDIRFLAEYTFVDIAAGTVMTMSGALQDDFSLLSVEAFSGANPTLAWRVLGGPMTDIRFSQPARFTVFTEGEHATPFTPFVLDNKGNLKKSISKQSDVACDSEGNVINSFQESEMRLDHHQASFYSCYGGVFSILPGFALGVDIMSDGSVPFHENSYDGTLYQGQDSTGSNLLVRAGDIIQYRISVFGSDQIQENISLELHITGSDGNAGAIFENIPQDCLSGSLLQDNNTTLYCMIDQSFLHDTFAFHLPVRIHQDTENQSRIQLHSSVSYQDTVLEQESLEVLVTNYFDNSTMTKITETIKNLVNFDL